MLSGQGSKKSLLMSPKGTVEGSHQAGFMLDRNTNERVDSFGEGDMKTSMPHETVVLVRSNRE